MDEPQLQINRLTFRTLRHSFATHLLVQAVKICEVQELFGTRVSKPR
jgi:site-specific recombinase XerD